MAGVELGDKLTASEDFYFDILAVDKMSNETQTRKGTYAFEVIITKT